MFSLSTHKTVSLQNQSSFHFCHYLGGQALWQYCFFELIPKACPQKCQELPGYFGWQHEFEFESDMWCGVVYFCKD